MDLILDDIYPTGDKTFDPWQLRPLASLNRRQVIALPAADPAWVGRPGWELLSKHALANLVGAQVKTLGLDGVDPANYPLRLNECLNAVDVASRLPAEAIAGEFGRRLGCLVASLLLSHAGLSDPVTAWEAAYLDYWRGQVRHIFLGGGHASGRLGALVAQGAQEALEDCGMEGYTFQAAQSPAWLPLIGAGRTLQRGSADANCQGAAVLVDCGGTRAKRGIAFYDAQGALAELRRLPEVDISGVTTRGTPLELAQAMLAVIVETMQAIPAEMELARQITVSVAAYVKDGQPLKINRDAYTCLCQVAADLPAWFAEHIQADCGSAAQTVQVEFVHDGDVAACALAGQARAAVIMLGSALGVGFVPPAEGYRGMKSELLF